MKQALKLITLFAGASMLVTMIGPLSAQNDTYTIDKSASTIRFVADSRLAEVPGVFHTWRFDGSLPANLEDISGTFVVEVASIDTDNERRDNHLRDPDFFEVERYPRASFQVEEVEDDGDYLIVSGRLTIKGVTKPVEMEFRKQVSGNAIKLTGAMIVNRRGFNITYDSMMNPIEDNVRLEISLTLARG